MKKLILPRLGETMEEATIVKWFVNEEDSFDRGQILAEIETDKTTVELPALESGKLKKILKKNGEKVKIKDIIALYV